MSRLTETQEVDKEGDKSIFTIIKDCGVNRLTETPERQIIRTIILQIAI